MSDFPPWHTIQSGTMCLWATSGMSLHVWDKQDTAFATSIWTARIPFQPYAIFRCRNPKVALPSHANYKKARLGYINGLLVLDRFTVDGGVGVVELVAHDTIVTIPDFKTIKKPGKMIAQSRWDRRPQTGWLSTSAFA